MGGAPLPWGPAWLFDSAPGPLETQLGTGHLSRRLPPLGCREAALVLAAFPLPPCTRSPALPLLSPGAVLRASEGGLQSRLGTVPSLRCLLGP